MPAAAPVVGLRNPGKSTGALATRIDGPRDTIDGNAVELFLSRRGKNVRLSCRESCVSRFELWRVTPWGWFTSVWSSLGLLKLDVVFRVWCFNGLVDRRVSS